MNKWLVTAVAVASLAAFTVPTSAAAAPRPPTDRTPPKVVSTAPVNGATNVPVGSAVTVTYNEALAKAPASYTFTKGTGRTASTVPVGVAYDAVRHAVTLTPASALSYASAYTVTMTAADLAGNVSTKLTLGFTTQSAPVNHPPVAALSVSPTSGDAPLLVTADATRSTDDNAVTSYTFSFGDGSATVGPQTGATATHTYTAKGSYSVTVQVRDAGGLSSSASAIVTVSEPAPPVNAAPAARLAVSPAAGDTPLAVTADASASTDTDAWPIATYSFDFGDGTTVGPQAEPTAVHSIETVGDSIVTVTVTDTAGLSSTATAVVHVYAPNTAPVARLTVSPARADAPVIVTADATASTDDRADLSYTFDFGDGTTAGPQLDATSTHRYATQGSYVVTVRVVDGGGLSDTASAALEIGAAPPAPVNDLSNASAELAKVTACPDATGWVAGPCPQFWFTAAHGGGVNTSTYEWSSDAHSGTRSLQINGSGFDTSTCTIGPPPPGTTLPRCGTAAWNYTPRPVTAGQRYLYTDWYKSDADTELDSTVNMADGTTKYFYLGTVPKSASWSQVRAEFEMPAGAVSMSVYHLVYQNGTLVIDDISYGPYQPSPFARGLVSVAFDDGYTSQYANALPVLTQNGVPGTFYVISGYLTAQPTYMTTAQIRALKAAGNDVQSHTVTHPNLVNLTADQLVAELQNSQQVLSTTLGSTIGDLAAPYGTQNTDTVAAVAKLYQSQRTMDSGYNSRDALDPYRLRVKSVRATTTPAQVQGWIEQASAQRTWLILVYHQVDTDPATLCSTCYGVTPTDFATEMQAVAQSGLGRVTVSQGLHETAPQAGVELTAVAPPSDELIVNASVEQPSPGGTAPANWLQGYWGDNTHSFTWTTDGHTGSRALRVDIGTWTNGQAKWYYPAVAVQGGQRYQFSDWYRSNAASTVSVAYTMQDGTIHYDGQDFAIPAAATWTKYSIGVVLPPGATSAFFSHAIGGTGYLPSNSYLETDDYSMTLSTTSAGLARGLVSLTFDDGSQSIYDALPAVEAYGWRTTQYLPTEGISQWVWSPSRIQQVYARGHEIASHSVTHPYLTAQTDVQLAAELRDSKATLERIIGAPVESFSSPYGDYDPRVIQAIRDAGYTSHRSVDVGYGTRYDFTPWNIHVENMTAATTMAEFNSWVTQAATGRYYLVIVYHEIMTGSTGDPGLDQYTTTPALFAQQLASISASGLTVKTVKDAVAEINPQVVAAP